MDKWLQKHDRLGIKFERVKRDLCGLQLQFSLTNSDGRNQDFKYNTILTDTRTFNTTLHPDLHTIVFG